MLSKFHFIVIDVEQLQTLPLKKTFNVKKCRVQNSDKTFVVEMKYLKTLLKLGFQRWIDRDYLTAMVPCINSDARPMIRHTTDKPCIVITA